MQAHHANVDVADRFASQQRSVVDTLLEAVEAASTPQERRAALESAYAAGWHDRSEASQP